MLTNTRVVRCSPTESCDTVQHVRPLLVGRYGADLVAGRQLYGNVHLPGVPGIDHGAAGLSVAVNGARSYQEPGDLVDGPLRGGQPDAGHRSICECAQPFHGEAQVGTPLVAHYGMQLVKDKGRRALQGSGDRSRR